MELILEHIRKDHHRSNFESREGSIQQYLRQNARQQHAAGMCTCFVLADAEGRVHGYFTLSAAEPRSEHLPTDQQRAQRIPVSRLPLPVILLGRLGRDDRLTERGFGRKLLKLAIVQAADSRKAVGSVGLVTDPVNEALATWYHAFGFKSLSDSGRMFLGFRGIEKLLNQT